MVIPVETPVQESFLTSQHIGEADREFDTRLREYWTRGYIALRGLFTPQEIKSWIEECDHLLQSEFVFPSNVRTPFRMNSGNRPERIDPVVDISRVFASVASDPRITGIVSAIFRDRALLFKDKLIFKAPGTDGYTMHQDQAYWQLCPADDILSVSIQIDGANAANGCIELFPGYHSRLLTPPQMRTNFRQEELDQVNASRGQKIETQPGDVLIFHSLTPHRSDRNIDTVSRRSIYLTYSAAKNGDFYELQKKNYIQYNRSAELTEFK